MATDLHVAGEDGSHRGLDRTWARPTLAMCLYLRGLSPGTVAELVDQLATSRIRDWIATVGDEEDLSADVRSVLEQARLDDFRFRDINRFRSDRWDAAWQAFVSPRDFEDVASFLETLEMTSLVRLNQTMQWSSPRGWIVRTSLLRTGECVDEAGWKADSSLSPREIPRSAGPGPGGTVETGGAGGASLQCLQSDRLSLVLELPSSGIRARRVVELAAFTSHELDRTRDSEDRSECSRVLLLSPSPDGERDRTGRVGQPFLLEQHDLTDGLWVPLIEDYLLWRWALKRQQLARMRSSGIRCVRIGALIATRRPEMLSNVLANLQRQSHKPTKTVIVSHGWRLEPTEDFVRRTQGIGETILLDASEQTPLNEVLAMGASHLNGVDWICKLDDDDFYGSMFLEELALTSSQEPSAELVGMYAEFFERIDGNDPWLLQMPIGWAECPGIYEPGAPAGAALMGRTSEFQLILEGLPETWVAVDKAIGEAFNGLGARTHVVDGINFVVRRHCSPGHGHLWQTELEGPLRKWEFSQYSRYRQVLHG